jgi:hypothetical protein
MIEPGGEPPVDGIGVPREHDVILRGRDSDGGVGVIRTRKF